MAGKPWTEIEIQFLRDNFELKSCAEIANFLQRTTRSVQHKFGQLGLERSAPKVGEIWERLTIDEIEQEEKYGQNISYAKCTCSCGNKCKFKLTEIKSGKRVSCGCKWKENLVRTCKERALIPENEHNSIILWHEEGYNCTEIAEKYNVEYYIISKILKDYDYEIDQSEARKIYSCDDKFFENIDSEEKAYWLGFIYGDGTVYGNKIIISLKDSDKEHLEKFKTVIKFDGPIKQTQKISDDKIYYGWRISISSKQIVKDLFKHGVHENKTLTLKFTDTIPKDLERHFWRGLVDADGHIAIHNRCCVFQMLGTVNILENLLKFIKQNNINTSVTINKVKHANVYEISTGGNILTPKIAKLLYQNAKSYLIRKYEVAHKIMCV